MKILTLYLGKTITTSIIGAVILLLGLDVFFSLVQELRSVGAGDYRTLDAIIYISLSIPQKIYRMFPLSALLGTLMGLGVLASHSELIVMRAQGLSIMNIISIVLKTAFVLAVLTWGLGEIVAPYLEQKAQHRKSLALSGGQALETDQGTWMRDGQDFVHIRGITAQGRLEGITRYEFDEHLHCRKISYADHGNYFDNHWILYQVEESQFQVQLMNEGVQKIEKKFYPQQTWNSVLSPSILSVVGERHLERLSLVGLWKTIQYREANRTETNLIKLAFWQKLVQPISTMVMMMLAIPFIFGPLRNATTGLRLLAGILVGFSFYTFHQVFGHWVLSYTFFSYSLPPILGACLPIGLFLLLGIIFIRRLT